MLLLIRDIQVLLELLIWFWIICPQLLMHYEDLCMNWSYLSSAPNALWNAT
jgi:hypothetical protein